MQLWEGQHVVDCEGEKIGRLEDIYFEMGVPEPAFACVQAGMLGRRHVLVPLAGASLSRDEVRVAYRHDQVKDAPQVEPGAALEPGIEQELARHYEIELTAAPAGSDRRYESARARGRRETRAREMTERADELTMLGAAMQLAREGQPQADDAGPGAPRAQDEPDPTEPGAGEGRPETRGKPPPSP